MDAMQQYKEMKRSAPSHLWGQRILTEIGYLYKVYEAQKKPYPALLEQTVGELFKAFEQDGVITVSSAQTAEQKLLPLGEDAKQYQVLFAAHAHIDMNWMWGLPETVSVVIDTFQTMLNLMKEYPDFVFSQSQASTYEIIEKYCPSMLPEIRQRIQTGQWEVTASTWVELDKNMSGTESMVRHILYTKNYLSQLLGIQKDDIQLDFEPDTFGHSAHIPEILNQGGIRYYYHCRGYDKHSIYRWKAPSGKEVLVFREPSWYLGPIHYDMVLDVPSYCQDNHTPIMMKVYGVGDHGGGPTRRDIERIREMSRWPLMPRVRFGRMIDFFKELEQNRDQYPVVDQELNFVFTGCYTSESRIKMANRVGEDRLYDGEALGAMARLQGADHLYWKGYEQGWRRILFNQFHDILPGSGVTDTREYAMGIFQEALSYAGANANRAMKYLGDQIDTSVFGGGAPCDSTAEGAGVGWNITKDARISTPDNSSQYGFTVTSRGAGEVRAYTIFNTLSYRRSEVVSITLWDWDYPLEELVVEDAQGNPVEVQIVTQNQEYWQHHFHVLLIPVTVEPFGYATYCFKRHRLPEVLAKVPDPRVHTMADGSIVMENDRIRAVFDSLTMKITSLIDKKTGKECADSTCPGGGFRLVDEDDVNGMSAWIVGGYSRVVDINEQQPVRITKRELGGLRQQVSYEMKVRDSFIQVTVTLDAGSSMLRFKVMADWHELGKPGGETPQLQWIMPVGYTACCYRYDVPGGTVDRPALGHDVPAVLYGAAVPEQGTGIMMTSDSKYGYRGDQNCLSLNLIRSSYEPDPYPEFGIHHMELGIGVCDEMEPAKLQEMALCFAHPLTSYSNSIHSGSLPLTKSFLQVDGAARVISLKPDESGTGVTLRLGTDTEVSQKVSVFMDGMSSAKDADLLEQETGMETVLEHGFAAELPAHCVRTFRLEK
ncbi:MAG: glycoside hydrolase family 38 C-terminal domain-containing protein [Massiliimalia sp.]|jgi:alpha-mannosidase